MNLTRRGWMTVGLIGATIAMAWLFGARSLNAVVAPALVALLAGVVQLRLTDPPTVERTQPRAGFPDDERTITLSVEGSRGTILSGRDVVGRGLDGEALEFEGTTPLEHEYGLTLTARGRHELGPARVVVRDALGLLSAEYHLGETTEVLVYPALVDVTGSELVATVFERNRTAVRGEFDRVREYVPGDPLRDVNWKASAKRLPDLIVTEYADRRAENAVTIAGEADDASVDAVASAIASVGLCLLDRGLPVAIAVPDGYRDAGRSERHRTAVLELLAETGPGTLEGVPDPDVYIEGRGEEVTVSADGRTVPWSEVADTEPESQFRSVRRPSPDSASEGEVAQ